MKEKVQVYLCDEEGLRFFGEGPYRLLLAVEETGSLRGGAMQMHMAYTKALRLITHAEEVLGFPLTQRTIGGKGGGGSALTAEARKLVTQYEQYRTAVEQETRRLFDQYFGPHWLCDSGLGGGETVREQ